MIVAVPDDYQDLPARDIDELTAQLRDAEAIVAIRERTDFSRELIARLPRRRQISQTGRSAHTVDIAACTERGIVVTAGTQVSPYTVAEHTWAMIFALTRAAGTSRAAARPAPGTAACVGATDTAVTDTPGATCGTSTARTTGNCTQPAGGRYSGAPRLRHPLPRRLPRAPLPTAIWRRTLKRGAVPAPPVDDDKARANRLAAANLALRNKPTFGYDPTKTGGVFQIRRLGYDSAEFVFVGWDKEIRRNTAQQIEQGDGEINGTAIEASLTPVLQFIVHKGVGRTMKWPRAEDAQHYYVMGMDTDLDVALKEAAEETIAFLQRERGLSPADAYSLASIGVNYIIGEAVDGVLMVYGAIPKKIFSTNREFWAKP